MSRSVVSSARLSVVPAATRRKEPRNNISITFNMQRLGRPEHAVSVITTENISRYGACLVTTAPPEVGEMILLTCSQDECELQGAVRYVRETEAGWRVGVEFVAFPKKWLIMQLAVTSMMENQWTPPRRKTPRG
ncbi:MAG: PilZ domain-containing protein [Blastocatellia bacterium]